MLYARKMDWKINDLFFDSDKRPMNFQGHIFLPYYRTTYSSAVVRGKENTFLFRFDSIDEKQQKSGLTKILETDYQNLRQLNWDFTTIFSHFFETCMNIFHKKEIQTVILRYLTGLNLDWVKNYDTKSIFLHFRFFMIPYSCEY